MSVDVSVEYCDICGSVDKVRELENEVKAEHPETNFSAFLGRQGSFEVSINSVGVYSKLATLAYPDTNAVCAEVKKAAQGARPGPITKQQPITDCCIM